MSKPDGGQAFPRTLPTGEFPVAEIPGIIERHAGMTLRDYFAGQALVAVVLSPGQVGDEARHNEDRAAAWAYSQADAMLKERDR